MSKYLIYNGSGGLVHMLTGLDKALNIAKKENRILIINLKKYYLFKNDITNFFDININIKYYENINIILNEYNKLENDNLILDNIENKEYDNKNFNIFKEKNITFFKGCGPGGLFPDFLKVNSKINKLILQNHNIKLLKEKYIGIHYRGTDRKHNLNSILEKLKMISNNENIKNIFLATDDYQNFDKIQEYCINNNYNFHYNIKPINTNGKALHYIHNNKTELTLNLLVDMYFLYKSNIFIESRSSNISKWINKMRNNNFNIFND